MLDDETLKKIRHLVHAHYTGGKPLSPNVTESLGLVNYDLQAPAKMIVPVFTPFQNNIPRVRSGRFWRLKAAWRNFRYHRVHPFTHRLTVIWEALTGQCDYWRQWKRDAEAYWDED